MSVRLRTESDCRDWCFLVLILITPIGSSILVPAGSFEIASPTGLIIMPEAEFPDESQETTGNNNQDKLKTAFASKSTDRPIADGSPIDFNIPAIYRDLLQINPLQGIRMISSAVANGKRINLAKELFLLSLKLKTVFFINGRRAFMRLLNY
ncbi:MAG: hypothetical protein A2W25_07515 [candidate division Zixibacteria bacterium RBG_16_53_22]|nr:MAG: hypothetical protein A2W25_07515 [candidate division Zixibacteria bacterium RBG_16_53_22]